MMNLFQLLEQPVGRKRTNRLRSRTLHGKRVRARLRHIGVAVCAAMCVFAVMQCWLSTVRTAPVVVATRTLARGSTLSASDIALVTMPANNATDVALSEMDAIIGSITRIDIDEGTPLFASMLTQMPIVPADYTVIDVALSSATAIHTVGDEVSLVAPVSCSDVSNTSSVNALGNNSLSADGTDSSDNADNSACVLTEHAVVIDTYASDADTAAGASNLTGSSSSSSSGLGSTSSHSSSSRADGLVSFAMPARDALRVLTAQQVGVIIALVHTDADADAQAVGLANNIAAHARYTGYAGTRTLLAASQRNNNIKNAHTHNVSMRITSLPAVARLLLVCMVRGP